MARAFRLAFAMQGLELVLLLAGALVLTAASLALAWQIRVSRTDELACYRAAPQPVEGSQASPCPQFEPWLTTLESGAVVVHGAATYAPFVLGLFLGVPIVAREVEHRTAGIAWSLSRSRRRWLVLRAAPILVVVALATLAVGISGDLLTHAMPWAEGSEVGFADHGARGPLVMVRGIAAFGIAMGLGALVPRQVPALLLAAGFTLALFVGVTLYMDDLMRREAEPLTNQEMQQGASQKIYDTALRVDATGEIISDEDYYRDHPVTMELPPGLTPVVYTIPGSRYGEFVLRESVILGAGAVLGIATTAVVVNLRRP
jgi:hypothetical protein